jgi:uncharacterized membrane protein YoaK (UPF0700 family)
MVLLGVSAGRRDATLAAHAGVSFAAYIAGIALGARLCGHQPSMPQWRKRAQAALGVELALLVGVTIGWELSAAHPRGSFQLGLLPMAVLAMAVQACLARSMPEQTPSTTYLTGTLTAAISALMTGSPLRDQQRRISAVLGLIAGAGLAAILVEEAPRTAPFLVLAVLVAAFAAATTDPSKRDRHPAR